MVDLFFQMVIFHGELLHTQRVTIGHEIYRGNQTWLERPRFDDLPGEVNISMGDLQVAMIPLPGSPGTDDKVIKKNSLPGKYTKNDGTSPIFNWVNHGKSM